MRILADECAPAVLVSMARLSGEVATAVQMGWASKSNGELLRLAEPAFDVLLTVDQNLAYQQPIGKFDICLVVVRMVDLDFDRLDALAPHLRAALDRATPGSVIKVVLES